MKHRFALGFLIAAATLGAETHTLTLREAVARALEQNPEVVMARLAERKAEQQVRIAHDPYIPKLYAGSGLAYTHGFPMTLEGSAPSLFEARAQSVVFNRPIRNQLAQVKEEARGAALAAEGKRDEIAMRAVELYLEAGRAAKALGAVRAQVAGLERVAEVLSARAAEGRELPVTVKRAELDVARARQRVQLLEGDLTYAESSLASVLGYAPGDRVRAAEEERSPAMLPASEEAALERAVEDNAELRRLRSAVTAQGFAVKAENSARLPRVNLVAKYGVFSRFNNYEEYFNRFQRHNGVLGVSFELPIYAGRAHQARAAQAEIEIRRLEAELAAKQSQLTLEARRSWQEVREAETAVEIARLDLEVAREETGVVLALMEEGRASLREAEAARYAENEKWLSFHEAHHGLELARYRLLFRTGDLLAALR